MCAIRSRSAHWFLGRAVAELIAAAKIPKTRIDGLAVASFTLAPDTAVGLTQHLGLTLRWLDHVPMGGASGIVSIRRAARAVQSGDAEIVACIAGDTNHTDSFRRNTSAFSQFSQDAVYPYGSGGPNTSFALSDRLLHARAMAREREDFGKLCVAQRNNALKNPLALFKKPLTLDNYLNARLIADPLRLFDCVMPCAGAEGFLVMRRATAEELWTCAFARLLGAIERHNAFPDDPVQYRGGWAHRSRRTLRPGRRRAGGYRFSRNLRRLSGHQRAAVRGSRFLPQGRGARFHPRQHLRGRGQLSRSTPRAGNCRSARPARPADISASSKRSASSPARRSAPALPTRGTAWSPASA